MNIKFGKGTTQYGPGVQIDLSGDEVATAIMVYLSAHDVNIFGARTVTVNGDLCEVGSVYVDPGAFVMSSGARINGNGTKEN